MSGHGHSPFVVLTRPVGKNELLAQRLEQQGIEALLLPALAIQPLPLAPNGLPSPDEFDLVVFVSGNAVRFYLDGWTKGDAQSRWPRRTVAATVGRSSASQLMRSQAMEGATIVHPSRHVPQDSESLWATLQPFLPTIKRVLIVRGQTGREWLGSQFEAHGAQVTRLAVYERVPAAWPSEQLSALQHHVHRGRQGVYLLTSTESVSAFHAKMAEQGLQDHWSTARFVVIHPRVARRLQQVLTTLPGQSLTDGISLCQPDDDAIFTQMHSLVSL